MNNIKMSTTILIQNKKPVNNLQVIEFGFGAMFY
jgi:hypothetical protein